MALFMQKERILVQNLPFQKQFEIFRKDQKKKTR